MSVAALRTSDMPVHSGHMLAGQAALLQAQYVRGGSAVCGCRLECSPSEAKSWRRSDHPEEMDMHAPARSLGEVPSAMRMANTSQVRHA